MNKGLPQTGWLLVAGLLAAGCASMSSEDLGGVIGAGVGAAVGAEVAGEGDETLGAVVGAVLGGLVGRKIGAYMDDRDRRQTAAALENNPTHQTSSWTNPDTGYTYSVTPTRTYAGDDDTPCRDFTVVQSGGDPSTGEEVASTACRDADGVWVSG